MVSFRIVYTSESASSDNITVFPEGVVVFQPGQTMAEISITVNQDEIPEENGRVRVELNSTTGEMLNSPEPSI